MNIIMTITITAIYNTANTYSACGHYAKNFKCLRKTTNYLFI